MEHLFFKDGDYEAVGGFFIRNDLKKFFSQLRESGLNPVGLKVDEDDLILEVIVEKNQAYIDKYENNNDAT